MTEVLFAASAVFLGYVVYALVEEQISSQKQIIANEPRPRTDLKTEPAPAKPKPSQAAANKPKAAPAAVKAKNVADQVGKAAGSVYRFLDKKGPISVAKLVQELKEDSKTVQRSIGWLAQEGKIDLETKKRVETISLVKLDS